LSGFEEEFRLGLEVAACEELDVVVCEEIDVDALDAMAVGSYCDHVVEPVMVEMVP
jgi:hypothetical protein